MDTDTRCSKCGSEPHMQLHPRRILLGSLLHSYWGVCVCVGGGKGLRFVVCIVYRWCMPRECTGFVWLDCWSTTFYYVITSLANLLTGRMLDYDRCQVNWITFSLFITVIEMTKAQSVWHIIIGIWVKNWINIQWYTNMHSCLVSIVTIHQIEYQKHLL